jgi:hypothetical protein
MTGRLTTATERVFCIVTAPLHSVHFRDFFLADQLNSLVLFMYDFEYTVCFYTADLWFGASSLPLLACSLLLTAAQGRSGAWPSTRPRAR